MISAFVFSVELVTFLIVWGTRTVWTPSGGHLARTTNTNKTKSEWFLLGNRTFKTSTVQIPLIISKVASEIKGSNLAVERRGEILTNETHRPGTLLVVSKRSTTRNRPRNEKKQWPCRLVCCRTSMQWEWYSILSPAALSKQKTQVRPVSLFIGGHTSRASRDHSR